MYANTPSDSGDGPSSIFSSETHLRILDISERRPVGYEVHALTEPSLYLVRARVIDKEGITGGSRLIIEENKVGPLSLLRYRDLSSNSEDIILDELMGAIKDNSEIHLGFYNRANNISLKVRPGERRAVLGSNGAGKTTLFNCITGDFPPSSRVTRLTVSAESLVTQIPALVDPVNDIICISGCLDNSLPTVGPSPFIKLKTPGG